MSNCNKKSLLARRYNSTSTAEVEVKAHADKEVGVKAHADIEVGSKGWNSDLQGVGTVVDKVGLATAGKAGGAGERYRTN